MSVEKVVVALVRPSPLVKPSTKNFKSKDYEIFLTLSQKNDRQLLGLPSFKVDNNQVQAPQDLRTDVMNFIFEITKETSQNNFGVKIKRIIFVKQHKIKCRGVIDEEAYLFVAATSAKHDPIINSNDSTLSAGFYCLHDSIKSSGEYSGKYLNCSKHLLEVYENWFKKIQVKPMALQGLFRPNALERIYENVTNPAFSGDATSDWALLENKINASQLMDKMKKLNEADVIVYNQSFGMDNSHRNKVDMLVVNKFYMQEPDYSKIVIPDREEWFKGRDISDDVREMSWEDEFLLHRAAADGDIPVMVDLLRKNYSRAEMWDNDGWAPVHYACWYGRNNALAVLLDAGCDPNVCNRNQTSLLHLAAGCGYPNIVQTLLNHPFIDHQAVDKSGRTALVCCEEIRSRDWQKCSQLLKEAVNKNIPTIVVKRMDGIEKKVKFFHGSNTSMQDVMNDLELNEEAKKYFTVWIMSKNLHLQLKPDHRPLIELKKWPTLNWTLGSQADLDPQLILKRDVKLLPSAEENVEDPFSIHLLYHEAYHQVMCGLYPCSDEVAIALAAIVAQIIYGKQDIKKIKPNFLNERKIKLLLPMVKYKNKLVNWHQKILTEYKELCCQNQQTDIHELQLLYLRYCWTQIPLYGSAFFNGCIVNKSPNAITSVCIGVNYRGIHIIKSSNMELFHTLSYHSLTWDLKEDEYKLHLKTLNEKLHIVLQTPQASLICSLMSKLSLSSLMSKLSI